MSFGSRLTHTVDIVRKTAGVTYDDYNHPIFSEATLATVKAAIQPRRESEATLTTQAGAAMTDYVIYMFPTDLTTADAIVHDATDCPLRNDLPTARFEVTGVPNAAGLGHHLEVAAKLVASPQQAEGS